jgi:hypothetical protein
MGADRPSLRATFVSLPGHTHFAAKRVGEQLLPRVLELLRSTGP